MGGKGDDMKDMKSKQTILKRIDELKPYDRNSKKHPKEQIERIQKSIEEFGFTNPILIDENNKILAGHGRVLAAKKSGFQLVPTLLIEGLNETQKKAYIIADNKLTESAWDLDMLASEVNALLEEGFDIDLLGIDSNEIDKMANKKDIIEDEAPEPEENPVAKTGDIWKLGQHVIMCGDSTKEEDVKKLMNGNLADMIHTDPPYNVDYGANKKNLRHKIRSIANDKLGNKQWEEFCKKLFLNFKDYNKGDIYMWGASGPEGMKMRLWLVESGAHWSATIIWKKDRIELCAMAIKNSSKNRDIVMDLFLGSGSTLIACEQTNRRCYGMELEPKYIDVIIKRWQTFTGKEAVRQDGKTYNEAKDEA